MTISLQPAPARTDIPVHAAASSTTTAVRRAGVAVTAGALTWATSMATFGSNPSSDPGIMITDLAAVPFQLGLFALVATQLRTRATGLTRVARGMLRVEFGLLTLATVWSVLHGAVPAFRDDSWLAVLDAFWPLSMLGMFAIGVKILFAGRWTGLARVWPLIAESWAVVSIPSMIIFGDGAVRWIGSGHLVVGYAVLGLLLATRPGLTGARN